MVEQVYNLDLVFGSLSDPTRRNILKRISKDRMSVGEIAGHFRLSFAGVAKHLKVLEQAGLVSKTRQGKQQLVAIVPEGLAAVDGYLENYRNLWERRLDRLDKYLKKN